MTKEIKKLEDCLKAMKRCLKIPKVENCICFSNAFKVLDLEANKLDKKVTSGSNQDKEKLILLKEEIEEIKKNISGGDKECLGCSPCIASIVFKTYPDSLNEVYMSSGL
jgi:hypothetical protein